MTPLADTTAPATPVRSTELLIDRYLPAFDVTIVEHLLVDAEVATTWRALLDLDLMQVHTPLMDAAMRLRGLPATVSSLLGSEGRAPPPPPELRLGGDAPALPGWLGLGELPDREIAFGAVGRFWQPDIEWYDVASMTPEEFARFAQPGWGRIAANFSLLPYGRTRTLASYEARTSTSDPASRRRFSRYWVLVRPFVGHIMRASLRSLREGAERADADRS